MNAIGVGVPDMDAAIAFYTDLGLDLTSTPGDHPS
jgi:catechol 2,3-dioxygenase-like lactoylglutathione lyase family enzyme